MPSDIKWTGKVNKLAVKKPYYLQAYRTIDGDFAWVVWEHVRQGSRYSPRSELIGNGRVQTESEAMLAAEECLSKLPSAQGTPYAQP